MKISVLNEWLSLTASLGVVAGLVFLGREIQQNTAVTRSAVAQDISNVSVDFFMRVAENPELAKAVKVANEDPSALSEIEIVQYRFLTGAVFLMLEGVYKQYQLGFLSAANWKPYEKLITGYLSNPVARDWWYTGGVVFSPEFEALVIAVSGLER